MIIEKYSEDLSKYVSLTHEACEGRYELSGYDLHVIEAALQQLQDILNVNIRERERKSVCDCAIPSPDFNRTYCFKCDAQIPLNRLKERT